MTLEEAYECLDLPQGTDLQKIRDRYSEFLTDYRMQIDNAPTPKLRESYQRNLTRLEEAYKVLSDGSSIDDSVHLPYTNKVNEPENSSTNTSGQNSFSSGSSQQSVKEAYALFSLPPTSSERQVLAVYQEQRTELLNIIATKTGHIVTVAKTELAELEKALRLILPNISDSDLYPERLSRQKEAGSKTARPTTRTTNTTGKSGINKTLLFVGAGVIALVLFVFFQMKGSGTNFEQEFSHAQELVAQNKIKEAEAAFAELSASADESQMTRVTPWLTKVESLKLELTAGYWKAYDEHVKSKRYIEALEDWNKINSIFPVTDPDKILQSKTVKTEAANQQQKFDELVQNGKTDISEYNFDEAVSHFEEALALQGTAVEVKTLLEEAKNTRKTYTGCQKKLEEANGYYEYCSPSDACFKDAMAIYENITKNCPGITEAATKLAAMNQKLK